MSDDYEHALGGLRGHIVYGEQTAGDTPVEWMQVKVALPYLRDAERALVAERTRADAAEAELARVRAQLAAACAARDEARAQAASDQQMVWALSGGRERLLAECARLQAIVDPLAAYFEVPDEGVVDAVMLLGRSEGQLRADYGCAMAGLDRLRAERDEARAVVAGRTVAPTDSEIAAHDGAWIVRYVPARAERRFERVAFCGVGWRQNALDIAAHSETTWWLPLDRDGRPCAWPVAP